MERSNFSTSFQERAGFKLFHLTSDRFKGEQHPVNIIVPQFECDFEFNALFFEGVRIMS